MTAILDLLIYALYFSFLLMFSAIFTGVAVTAASIALERFIEITLPILAELYGRIRYPDEFKDEE